jgi:hypothetical protein
VNWLERFLYKIHHLAQMLAVVNRVIFSLQIHNFLVTMQAAIPGLMVFANTPEQKRHEEIRENLKTKT